MATKKARAQQGIQSIEVGNELLIALESASQPMTLTDLAKAAKMSAPKAHRYLVSYARMGLVEQESETGRYDLGEFALRLGLSALGRLDAVTVAAGILRNLAEDLRQTVALAVWANHGATIVRWVAGESPVSASLRVGSVMPLSRSATGMLFLSYLPEQRWAALLKAEMANNVRQRLTPQSAEELETTIERIRRQGFARTNNFIPGLTGIAAPVFGHDNTVALALVALGYSESFEADESRIRSVLVKSSKDISRRLGSAVG
jgi:DNA-binding IclR family transcriptional regulator